MTLSQVALGGAVGASMRFLANGAALRAFGPAFPYGIMAVNILGSFLMGVLFVWLSAKGMTRASPFLLSGVLGGFTTFSAFSLDAFLLYERGQVGLALAYVLGSVILSIAALGAGVLTMRGIFA